MGRWTEWQEHRPWGWNAVFRGAAVGGEHGTHKLACVDQCPGLKNVPQIHVHLEPLNVNLEGNRALNPMTCVLIRGGDTEA